MLTNRSFLHRDAHHASIVMAVPIHASDDSTDKAAHSEDLPEPRQPT